MAHEVGEPLPQAVCLGGGQHGGAPEFLSVAAPTPQKLEEEIGRHLDPFVAAINRLDPVPGCNPVSLRALLAEMGTDMAQFPTAQHLCRGACVCPGHQESAGRGKRGAPGKGIAGYEGSCIRGRGRPPPPKARISGPSSGACADTAAKNEHSWRWLIPC
ncbi:MAG: transposase [Acidobacteriia bacterium]|nr:transposase [Terriglobia bacterium]